jgi:tetratricopeptide (TPR) repeat protein
MLLLIDDIHWADRSSVILLRHIASSATIARHDAEIRGGPSPRLAIVGSTRNTNEYGKTLRFINELCESDLADKLTLTPLSEEGVRQLVSNQIGARYDEVAESLSSRIAMECLGNPFYICQTIREWKLNGRIKFDGLLWGLSSEQFADGETLPDSVREALQARLRKLPDVTAKTLGIAAVMGANVDVDLLQLLAGQRNEFGFFDTLDDLLGREILRETGRPKILAFAHDLLREACLSNLSATRRQGIHQIIGEALERQRESGKNVTDSLLAEHFLAAHCDKKAFEYLVRAGCSATATYAHADAVSLLEKAKQLDSPSYAKSVRYRLYEHLGASYAAIGRFENSIDEFESAFEVAQSQFELAKIHFGIGKAHTWIGRNDKGRESYESALKLIGHPQPKSKLGYAWGAILSGIQFQFAPRWRVSFWQKKTDTSSETLASEIYFANCFLLFQIHILAYVYGSIQLALLAKHSNDSDAIALAYSKYGMNMAVAGAIGQYLGRRYLREAESRLEQCKSPFVRSLAIQSLATASYYEGDLDSAEKKLVAIQLELDKSRDWHAGVNFHWRRHVASQRGVATEIQALALAEMEFGDRSCEPILKAWGRYGLADALSRQGDFDRAIECAAESVALLEKTVLKSVAYQELGRALIQASRYEEAEKTLQTGLRQMRSDLFCLDVTVQTLSLYPEAILGSDWFLVPSRISKDRRKRGYRAAKNARWWAMLFPNMRAHTYRVSGRASAASGKTREALRHFDRALREATRFGNQSEYARTLVDKSMLLRGEESERLRREGLSRLKDLHTVLPVAEAVHLEVQ